MTVERLAKIVLDNGRVCSDVCVYLRRMADRPNVNDPKCSCGVLAKAIMEKLKCS